jgi:POT family proton-dependent oligopeptide transporter
MFAFGFLGYIIPGSIFGSDTTDAFILGCLPVIGFFIYLMVKANAEDKRPIAALLSVYACIVIFWAVFHQNGDALTVWAEDHTDRALPASVSGPVKNVGMGQTVTYGEYVSWSQDTLDARVKALDAQREVLKTKKDDAGVKAISEQIKLTEESWKYFKNLPEAKRPPKQSSLLLVSAELFQSINPFWVVVLTPVVVGFFGMLRRRGKEPTTPTKIFLGLVITALSTLVMFAAVKATDLIHDKASAMWLVAAYGVITVGELCLSPMGLSLVSKLSPPRLTALMMGGFFLSTSLGNKLAGSLSGLWEGFEDKSYFFLMNFGLVMVAAALLFVLLKWLNKVMKEKGIQ